MWALWQGAGIDILGDAAGHTFLWHAPRAEDHTVSDSGIAPGTPSLNT